MSLKSLFFLFSLSVGLPVLADARPEQQALVDRARTTVEMLARDDNHNKGLASTLQRCYGVVIVPQLVRAGFILGAEGGSGIMLKRNANGSWVGPSFIRMMGGSIGLQIGVEQSEIMLVVMTERGFNAMMNDSFNLGADVSIAMGPMGGGRSASTTANLNADVFAFSRAQGAFAGGSLKGSVIKPRFEWNREYQGVESPVEILVKNAGTNNGSIASLSSALSNLERGAFVKASGGNRSDTAGGATMDGVPQGSAGSSDAVEIVPFKPIENVQPLGPMEDEKPLRRAADKEIDPAPKRTPALSQAELEEADEILVKPLD